MSGCNDTERQTKFGQRRAHLIYEFLPVDADGDFATPPTSVECGGGADQRFAAAGRGGVEDAAMPSRKLPA